MTASDSSIDRRTLLVGALGLGAGAAALQHGLVSDARAHVHPVQVPDGPVILTARSIITMDSRRPRVRAVGIRNGRIHAVGTIQQCREVMPHARVVDLGEATLMPGFVEPHSHPIGSGLTTEAPAYNVAPWIVTSWAGVEEVARKAAREVPEDRSIVLFGLDRLLHQCPFPDATVMDDLFGDRIAGIIALSQHQAAVTTATLRRLGWIDNPPQDPPGGHYGRRADGSLDGTAFEIPALTTILGPVLANLGGNPLGQAAAYLARMAGAGITTMGDLGYSASMQTTYEALCGQEHMPMRVSVYHATNDPGYLEPLETSVPRSMLRKGGIKFWADGSPWLGTIATTFPYLDTEVVRNAGITDLHPGEKALNYNREQLDAMLETAAPSGWQVACHANGDMTIDLVLDAYEDALRRHDLIGTDHRWRLEHVGAVRRDQLERMSRLGVVPTFALFQMMQWGDLLDGQMYDSTYGRRWSPIGAAARVDADHLHQSYHNDGNISEPSPLANVQAAITRRSNMVDRTGRYRLAAGNVHGPRQRVELDVALRGITLNAAYILKRDTELGSISIGKRADFAQLSQDPYEVDSDAIVDEVEIVATWLAGRPTDVRGFVEGVAGRSTPRSTLALRQQPASCCSHTRDSVRTSPAD